MTDHILQVRGVSKAFASHLALDNVSLDVRRGSIYGLLGPNGAGKTTLIRIINHITAPDSGEVIFDGHPLTQADTASIGYLPEERGLYKKMKVGEQAVFFARLKGLSKAQAVAELKKWFDRFGILSWWDKKVTELSKGMAQKVQFIITVLHRPKLLIFDEPFSGFDPINADLLKHEILSLRDQGATVIFSTHNMASVEEICDDITLLNQSHNVLSGSVQELCSRYFDRCYQVDFQGDRNQLQQSLQEIATQIEPTPQGLTLRLNPGVEPRELITMCNSKVQIDSFAKQKASMEQIFIQTIKNSQQSSHITTEEPKA